MSAVWGKGKRKSSIVRTGSPWVNATVDAFASYLRAYTIAGLHTPGTKTCVEAFVGAGYRRRKVDAPFAGAKSELAMPTLAEDQPQDLLAGMSKMMLETNPAFHAYRFIDPTPARKTAIRDLRREFPWLERDKALRAGVPSDELSALSAIEWKDHRALLFLDPFGMDVEWEAIAGIARTGAIDLWVLYPLGLPLSRLASDTVDVPGAWRRHLDQLLGSDAWRSEFVRAAPEPSLFRDELAIAHTRSVVIGRHVAARLRSVFPAVSETPQVLRDDVGRPLYLCCFAASARDATTSIRFANSLLSKLAK
jgi:three-Cys-motif partner protein